MTARQGTQVEQVCKAEGDHVMRTTQSVLDRVPRIAVERGTRSRTEASRLVRGCVQELAPLGSRKKIWEEEVLSLNICLSAHLTHTTQTSTLSRIKCARYILTKKCVRSFIELRKSWVYNKYYCKAAPLVL